MAKYNPIFTPEELANEEWRRILGFKNFYSVSNLGRVKSEHKRGRILKPGLHNRGYVTVSLGRNNTRYVHILVATAFIGACPNGLLVNHKDTIKHNNRLDNLEYCTPKQNSDHAKSMGLRSVRKITKLNERDIPVIVELINQGVCYREIGEKFGVSSGLISDIKNKRAWKHITQSSQSSAVL